MKTTTFFRSLAATAIAGSLVVGVGACGKVSDKVGDKIAEKSVEKATGAKVDTKKGEFSLKTKDGEFSSKTTTKLPDGWPTKILPVPSGFKVTQATKTKTSDGTSQMVSVEGTGDSEKLLNDYAKAFKANGIEVSLQTSSGDGGMVNGTKGDDNYGAIATVDGKKVSLTLTITTTTSTD